MEFTNINDVKSFIKDIRDNTSPESDIYDDLQWFSSNNYTTTSEYFGELGVFIQGLAIREDMKQYKEDIEKLDRTIKQLFK